MAEYFKKHGIPSVFLLKRLTKGNLAIRPWLAGHGCTLVSGELWRAITLPLLTALAEPKGGRLRESDRACLAVDRGGTTDPAVLWSAEAATC